MSRWGTMKGGMHGVALATAIVGGSLAAHADGDPLRGARTFTCGGCHTVTSDRALMGPSLQGIIGRRAATRPGYIYSAALKEAGEKGLVWTDADLAEFAKSPKTRVPGTKMPRLPYTDQQIDDIIAYLKTNPDH